MRRGPAAGREGCVWPPVRPVEGRDPQRRPPSDRIVSVIHDQVVRRPKPNRFSAGSAPSLVGLENLGSAALEHVLSTLVKVGAGDLLRPPSHRAVGALGASAAKIPGNKKVIVAAPMHDERGFDSLPGCWQSRLGRRGISRLFTSGKRVEGLMANRYCPVRGQFAQLDSTPKTAECEPASAMLVGDEIWIDGVVIVRRSGL